MHVGFSQHQVCQLNPTYHSFLSTFCCMHSCRAMSSANLDRSSYSVPLANGREHAARIQKLSTVAHHSDTPPRLITRQAISSQITNTDTSVGLPSQPITTPTTWLSTHGRAQTQHCKRTHCSALVGMVLTRQKYTDGKEQVCCKKRTAGTRNQTRSHACHPPRASLWSL